MNTGIMNTEKNKEMYIFLQLDICKSGKMERLMGKLDGLMSVMITVFENRYNFLEDCISREVMPMWPVPNGLLNKEVMDL